MNALQRNRSLASRSVLHNLATTLAIVLVIGTIGCAATQPIVQRDDLTISNDVRARIAADAEVRDSKVLVETNAGIVRISGAVATEPERNSAERIARETPGVRGVDNDVRFGATTLPPATN